MSKIQRAIDLYNQLKEEHIYKNTNKEKEIINRRKKAAHNLWRGVKVLKKANQRAFGR